MSDAEKTLAIPVRRYPGDALLFITTTAGPDIPISRINGRDLISRKDLIRLCGGNRHYIDRLVNRNLLTPYFPNGLPKKRIAGKYPGGATSYDYKQFKSISNNT